MKIGYTLSSEEHPPRRLVDLAADAEAAGFQFLTISDHFHPWVSRQGQSAFVWSTIGGVACSTERIPLAVGVTCPILRIHPAVVAHAAATAAAMMPGRFSLGVGTGERLNEHVLGQRWPAIEERREMLEEAIEVMRRLWTGDSVDHRGEHFTVENARLHTCPETPPPVVVSAFGPTSAEMAGRVGDGLWSTAPSEELVEAFERGGGDGPRYGQITMCWAEDEAAARRTALEYWPNSAIPGQLASELPTPSEFEDAAELVTEDALAEKLPCGPDLDRVVEQAEAFEKAGFTHLHLHQIGPDQEGFLRVAAEELLDRLAA